MSSVVYFFSDGGRAIKIGTSKAVGDRLREVQLMHPVEIEFLGASPGTYHHEAEIHRRLRKHRLRGEWFVDCEEVRDLMTTVLRDGTEWLGAKFRDRRSVSGDEFVAECVETCALLVKHEKARGLSTYQAIESIAVAGCLSRGKVWQFRYRPPRTVSSADLRAMRKAQIEITKAITGASHASVRAAEALVGETEGVREWKHKDIRMPKRPG